jgi:hypothetical protein
VDLVEIDLELSAFGLAAGEAAIVEHRGTPGHCLPTP